MGSYLRPAALPDAIGALSAAAAARRPLVIVAGATDHYPARVIDSRDEDILDISGVAGMRTVHEADGGWWIPALATWSDILDTPLPPGFDGLRLAAQAVGGRQIQNRGTVVGNLVNASPAADGLPNLLALDAKVSLVSTRGERRVSVGAFVTGNRSTVREADELVTGLFIPAPPAGLDARATFLKLGSRAYLVISIAMVAALITVDAAGRIATARVVVGACSPVARRLIELELALVGQPAQPGLGSFVQPEHLAALTPIDDIRGSAVYRLSAVEVLVRRALESVAR